MKTQSELQHEILNITETIHREYPELSKYIGEMPVCNSDRQEVNVRSLEEFYQSLINLVDKYAVTHSREVRNDKIPEFPGNIPYPPSEDIYVQSKQETDINPEDISKKKAPNENNNFNNEKAFKNDMSGGDLDIPGSELDDQQESVGSEDEENNYYSLGGDAHNDLEENN